MSAEPERQEFRCRECGYGICAERLPEACPICRGGMWAPVGIDRLWARLEAQAVLIKDPAGFEQT